MQDEFGEQIHVCASSLQFSHGSSSTTGIRSGTGMAIAEAWFCAQGHMFVFGSLSCWKIKTCSL